MRVSLDDPRLESLRITVNDLRRNGYCAAGIQEWFLEHDLDFRDFLKNGLDAKTALALATSDGYAEQILADTLGQRE